MDINPKQLQWTPPSKYEDGSAFGAADFAGYEFGFRLSGTNEPYALTVAVPVSFDVTTLDFTTLSLPQLTNIDFAMRTVAKNGEASAWTSPLALRFDTRRPLAPSALRVA